MVILKIFKSQEDKIINSASSPIKGKGMPWAGRDFLEQQIFEISLEREKLLSKNTGDPTVDSLRDKKENCSTRRGLRVGTGFVSF